MRRVDELRCALILSKDTHAHARSAAIRNFKSIRDQTLKLGPLNIFIGGNGSGKSNLIEVFRFLHEIVDQ